jgi:nitrogen fixation protein FixH
MGIRISWGTRIAFLYIGFVALIATLVISATRMDFDLVSKDYYQQEIGYQKRLDATAATSALSQPLAATVNATNVVVLFPQEFAKQTVDATIRFYSPINDTHDREFKLQSADGKIFIERAKLDKTAYTLQVSWNAGDKDYYQELPLNLTN